MVEFESEESNKALEKARLYNKQGEYAEALAECERAETAGWGNSDWAVVKSTSLIGLKRKKDAEAFVKAKLEEYPDKDSLYYNLMVIKVKQRKLHEAEAVLEEAQRNCPWTGRLAAVKTLLLVRRRRYKDAVDFATKELENFPDEPLLHYYLGYGYFGSKPRRKSKEEFHKAVALDSSLAKFLKQWRRRRYSIIAIIVALFFILIALHQSVAFLVIFGLALTFACYLWLKNRNYLRAALSALFLLAIIGGALSIYSDIHKASFHLTILSGHTDSILYCVFSPDGKQILSASADKTLILWNARSGRLIRRFRGHRDEVTSCAFSHDGSKIVSGSDDQTAKLWEVETGQLLKTLRGHTDCVSNCTFSLDDKEVLTTSYDSTIRLWDTVTGQGLRTSNMDDNGFNSFCAFSPDLRQVASPNNDTNTTLCILDVATGRKLKTLRGRHKDNIWAVAFSPDGKLIVSASTDKTLKIWDVRTGHLLKTLKGHKDQVACCAFSPDGRRIVSGGDDGKLRVWDVRTGKRLLGIPSYEGIVRCCAFSPDGKDIVFGGSYQAVQLCRNYRRYLSR